MQLLTSLSKLFLLLTSRARLRFIAINLKICIDFIPTFVVVYINDVTQYFSLSKPILYSGVTSPLLKFISVKTAKKCESASECIDFQTRNKNTIQIMLGDLRKCDSKYFVNFYRGLNLISSGSCGKLIVVPK